MNGRFRYDGALPGSNQTVELCAIRPVDGGSKWVSYALRPSQSGTIQVSASEDAITWYPLESVAVTGGTTEQGEFFVEPFLFWKAEWVNGGVAQTSFFAALAESAERAQAYGGTGDGAAIGLLTTIASAIQTHGAAVSGNPVLLAGEARTSDGTAVDNGDAVRLMTDSLGKQVVLPGALHERYVIGVTNITDTAADDLIAAAASTRTVVTGISVTNKDPTQGTTVSIRDGTTAKVTAYAAPGGGGFVIAPGAPIFLGTANTAITAICGSDSSDCDITVWGYQIPG